MLVNHRNALINGEELKESVLHVKKPAQGLDEALTPLVLPRAKKSTPLLKGGAD
jgi:hypothetical protein